MMDLCYWNHSGKHQKFMDALDTKAPRIGYTENPYMNLYLTMVHLYYDAYNNGGCNVRECYMNDVTRYVSPCLPDISPHPFFRCEFEKMEQVMDRVLEHIRDKDLSFPVYTVWLNYEEETLSRVSPAVSELGNWTAVTFGEQDRLDKFCKRRIANHSYRDVTEELNVSKGEGHKVDQVIRNASERSKKQAAAPAITRSAGR